VRAFGIRAPNVDRGPEFHEATARYADFCKTTSADVEAQIRKYPEDIEFAVERFQEATLKEAVSKGGDPKRIDSLDKHILDLAAHDKKRGEKRALKARAGKSKKSAADRARALEARDELFKVASVWQWRKLNAVAKEMLRRGTANESGSTLRGYIAKKCGTD
jgi:hypothetical protein